MQNFQGKRGRDLIGIKEGKILVCEGDSDLELLESILLQFVTSITTIVADGKANLKALRAFMRPEAYVIRDRDFEYTSKEAIERFEQRSNYLFWTSVDMEGLLIHADWLFQLTNLVVVPGIDRSDRMRLQYPPNNEQEVEQTLIDIAAELVPDHAGRRTFEIIRREFSSTLHQWQLNQVQGGAGASSEQEWRDLLLDNVQNALESAAEAAKMDIKTRVEDEFQKQMAFYDSAASSVDTIRREFSGKRILQHLAQHWQVTNTTPGQPHDALRYILVDYFLKPKTLEALEDSPLEDENRVKRLLNDKRAGDIGQLAACVLDIPV